MMEASRINRTLKAIAVAACVAVFFAGCGRSSNVTTQNANPANRSAAGGTVVAASGTTFYGKLQQAIGSKSSHNGDTFSLAQTDTLLHRAPAALRGSTINGHLEGVHAAGPLHKPAMTLVFDNITFSDGTKAPVSVQLLSMKAFEAKSHKLRTLGLMAGGAIAAHEIAKHTGGAGHGLMGMAGGYVLSQALKTDIAVPAGTVLELKFTAPVSSGSSQ
ncbi:MAG: hypothetical protein JO024_06430 [Candidatus Eremiobacteraeota bacterium]|nr:hypothetical protein [Candidatus Eremiobacteraeota bacterium]